MSPSRALANALALGALSPSAQVEVEGVLMAREVVLWSGRPVPRAAWADLMPGTISKRWACLVLYLITAALAAPIVAILLLLLLAFGVEKVRSGIDFWDLVTLPILLVLLLAAGHFLMFLAFPLLSIHSARERSYVLTDRQAITVSETAQGVQLACQDLGDVETPRVTRKRKDGLGDVVFGGYCVRYNTGDGGMDVDAHFDTGFTACPDAERVAALFADARLKRLANRDREDMEEMQQDYQGWLRRKGRL